MSVMHSKPYRIGWIIGGEVPRKTQLYHRSVRPIGGTSLVRFQWISEYINSLPNTPIVHKRFHPWGNYDCLIFLKSMSEECIGLMNKYKQSKKLVVFDSNVNYYESFGPEYYTNMLPTTKQNISSIAMSAGADGVIADSEYIKSKCIKYNDNTVCITDNVRTDLASVNNGNIFHGSRLKLIWCGESLKLFELLCIEELLLAYKKHIRLVIVTNNLSAINRWNYDLRDRFNKLLSNLNHELIDYTSIENLFQIYSRGGIFISPRFLDNSYNYGHTEWKITLPMSCGLVVLCSPVPSYKCVAKLVNGLGVKICEDLESWESAIE